MKGYITIEPKAGPKQSTQVRAHCYAANLTECNRTLLYNVYPRDVNASVKQAERSLKDAGCSELETTDLRIDS